MVETTVGTGVTMLSCLAVVALVLSGAIALLGVGLVPADEKTGFQVGLLAIAASMLVRFPCMTYGATLFGYQRIDLMNAAQIVTIVSFPIGTIVAVETGAGVLGVCVAFAASLALGGLAWMALLNRLDGALSLRPRLAHRTERARFLSFSSFALFADAMSFVATRMDTVVIAAFRGAAAAAPFAAAVRLQGGMQSLVRPFLDLLMPMTSELKARGEERVIAHRLVLATRVSVHVTLPVAVGVALFSADLTDVWLGSDAPDVTGHIIVLLVAAQVFALAATPAYKVLIGIGQVRTVGALATLEGVLNLGVSIVLVSTYGAIGAAIGTLSTTALLSPIRWPLVCRALGYPTRQLISRGIFPGLIGGAPAVGAMAGIYAIMPVGGARLAVGLPLGLGLAAAIGVAQVGPRRVLEELGALRQGRRESTTGGPQHADRTIR
jgi:O-antigen/teichoic acid export membrane protein